VQLVRIELRPNERFSPAKTYKCLLAITHCESSNQAAQSLLLPSPVAKRDRILVGPAPRVYSLFEQDKEFVMLVLSRKVGERIHVGDDIILEIRRITGNRVTLALDAPRNVRILRGELERAAREFHHPPQMTSPSPVTSSTVVSGRMAILNNLPNAAPTGRDFAI
jgi:carbon storage regulator CsrA